jgi:hypothetical protein
MLRYQVIEDNGGGLHLAVFDGGSCVYLHSGYEYNRGQLSADLSAIANGGNPITDEWDGNADDPQAEYDAITEGAYGHEIVADQYDIYPDLMGAAAKREFGIEEDA